MGHKGALGSEALLGSPYSPSSLGRTSLNVHQPTPLQPTPDFTTFPYSQPSSHIFSPNCVFSFSLLRHPLSSLCSPGYTCPISSIFFWPETNEVLFKMQFFFWLHNQFTNMIQRLFKAVLNSSDPIIC